MLQQIRFRTLYMDVSISHAMQPSVTNTIIRFNFRNSTVSVELIDLPVNPANR